MHVFMAVSFVFPTTRHETASKIRPRYRKMHAISLDEHNALLSEQGWKKEDFELGFHKDIAASHSQRYAAMMKSELAKTEVRSQDGSTAGGGVSPLYFCRCCRPFSYPFPCLALR